MIPKKSNVFSDYIYHLTRLNFTDAINLQLSPAVRYIKKWKKENDPEEKDGWVEL